MSGSGRARSITGFQKKSTKIVVDGATVYRGFFFFFKGNLFPYVLLQEFDLVQRQSLVDKPSGHTGIMQVLQRKENLKPTFQGTFMTNNPGNGVACTTSG